MWPSLRVQVAVANDRTRCIAAVGSAKLDGQQGVVGSALQCLGRYRLAGMMEQ